MAEKRLIAIGKKKFERNPQNRPDSGKSFVAHPALKERCSLVTQLHHGVKSHNRWVAREHNRKEGMHYEK
jgi:hypothetical protein